MLKWACSIQSKRALFVILELSNIIMFQGKKGKSNFIKIIISWRIKHVIKFLCGLNIITSVINQTDSETFTILKKFQFLF